jgi:uncharacterized protein (TIGR00369 family)
MTPPDGFVLHTRRSPLTDPWQPVYARATEGVLCLGLEVREPHCNGRGFAHGGLLSALADNAMGLSAVARRRSEDDAPLSAVTIGLALDFLETARIGDWLEVVPAVLKVGRSLAFCEAKVLARRGDERLLVARCNATFRFV